MLADIASLFVTFVVIGTPIVLFTRLLLQRRADSLGVPARIRWGALLITTILVGGLFASAWLIPVIYLLPQDEGPQKEGPLYVAAMALGQTLVFMPIICGLPSTARRFLLVPSDSNRQLP